MNEYNLKEVAASKEIKIRFKKKKDERNNLFGRMTKKKRYDNMDESVKLLTPKYYIFGGGGEVERLYL